MASSTLFPFLSIFSLTLLATASAVGFSVELIHRNHPKSPFYNPTISISDRVHAEVQRSHARAAALRRTFFSQLRNDMSSTANTKYSNLSPPAPDFTHLIPADSSFPYTIPSDTPFPSPADSPIPYLPPADSPFPTQSPASPNAPIETDIIANSFDYLVSIHLGTPTREVIAIADTGSDLIWVTCKPCADCYKQDAPLFNPATSSSYANLPCSTKKCNQLPSSQCDNSASDSKCIYQYGYGDGSQTIGNLAQETVTFNTTSGGTVGFPKVAFGCSHVANGTFERHSAGLVGLGSGPLSLVSQLGSSIEHRFSYCLVPYDSANITTSRLSFGSDAISSHDVETTTMVDIDRETFYTVTLDGITVGKNNTLGPMERSYMIVDSGTTLTYLDSTVLEPLVELLAKTIHLPQVEDNEKLLPLCFDESNVESDFVYPDITLQLGKATVTLKPYNAFRKINDKMTCLAMTSNNDISGDNLSILGNIAQQNFHVGFDLASRKISFAPADCTKY
ncbi:Eukaryotic aspartyl protease family protein [Rhynchospora pubera]|uniref:Eukaryotic aspartyl protease family protein n=1 Tax=Rhynchospora pubera TaxID=906938 RepID=A0AAV8GI12_9POAL|nr:Eukaryotic aspartyl protease family protein [Rhynchospora pubera]